MSNTIPEAIGNDLKADFLAHLPPGLVVDGLPLDEDRVRTRNEQGELPSPRLVILCGEPRYVPRMSGTARVPVSLEWITSQDRVTPEEHAADAGKIEDYWRALQASKRKDVIHSEIWLHDLIITQSSKSIRAEEREQVTVIRGDMVVTLVDLT